MDLVILQTRWEAYPVTHGSVTGTLVVPSHPRWADKTGLPEAFLPESLLMFKDSDTGQPASARSSSGQSAPVATPGLQRKPAEHMELVLGHH